MEGTAGLDWERRTWVHGSFTSDSMLVPVEGERRQALTTCKKTK